MKGIDSYYARALDDYYAACDKERSQKEYREELLHELCEATSERERRRIEDQLEILDDPSILHTP